MIVDEDIYLEHWGVKGMRWGVRKDKLISDIRSKATRKNVITAAKILGSAAVAAAVVAGAAYISQHGNVSTSDIGNASKSAKKFADSIAKEPVSIVHAARAKHTEFSFPQRGGLEDPFVEFEQAGFDPNGGIKGSTGGHDKPFKRYGDNNEKIALEFFDPEERKDFSGRPVRHAVVLPKELADGVNNHEEAVAVAWPLLKDTYQALWDNSLEKRY